MSEAPKVTPYPRRWSEPCNVFTGHHPVCQMCGWGRIDHPTNPRPTGDLCWRCAGTGETRELPVGDIADWPRCPVCDGDGILHYGPSRRELRLASLKKVATAARTLLAKLDAVHADPAYRNVWETAQGHNGPYTGPNYIVEMEQLAATLDDTETRDK